MLSKICKIFAEVGISKEWLYALSIGKTTFYNDDTIILNYFIANDICVINSGSIRNAKFTKSMLKDIKTLINEHKSVIISSNVDTIDNYLKKYNFRYNSEKQIYERGITWE